MVAGRAQARGIAVDHPAERHLEAVSAAATASVGQPQFRFSNAARLRISYALGVGMEISIIVPCRNEAENVIELAERARAMFEARGIAGEVVFVDDGSTDHTGALIDELAAQARFRPRPSTIRATRASRPAGRAAAEAARGRYVVVMDGDLQNLPEDVYRLYRQLKYSNADIVQGWRSHIGPRARLPLRHEPRAATTCCGCCSACGCTTSSPASSSATARSSPTSCAGASPTTTSRPSSWSRPTTRATASSRSRRCSRTASWASRSSPRFPLKMILRNLVDLAKGVVEFRLLSRRTDVLGRLPRRHPPARPPRAAAALAPRRTCGCSRALMPLHHWKLSSPALRYYYQLRRTQWLSAGADPRAAGAAAARADQARLPPRAVLPRAARPARHRARARSATLEDLQRLPVLTKDDIRRNLHFDLMSDAHDKREMLPITTSGSTGEPLTLYADKTQLEMRWATTLRNIEWTGYRFGDRQVRLWHSTLGMGAHAGVQGAARRAADAAHVLPGASR